MILHNLSEFPSISALRQCWVYSDSDNLRFETFIRILCFQCVSWQFMLHFHVGAFVNYVNILSCLSAHIHSIVLNRNYWFHFYVENGLIMSLDLIQIKNCVSRPTMTNYDLELCQCFSNCVPIGELLSQASCVSLSLRRRRSSVSRHRL